MISEKWNSKQNIGDQTNFSTLTTDHKPEMKCYSAQNVWRRIQEHDHQVGKAKIDDEVVGGTVKPSVFLYDTNDHCITKNRYNDNNQERGNLKPFFGFGEEMDRTVTTRSSGWSHGSIGTRCVVCHPFQPAEVNGPSFANASVWRSLRLSINRSLNTILCKR